MEHAKKQAVLFAFGVNHKTASVQVREKVYVYEHEMQELLNKFKQTLSECVIISTCNRTEIYGLHPTADIDFDYYKDLLINFKNASDVVTKKDFFSLIACTACEQLYKVATSVDSKIVGDTQILQQVRQSYKFAKNSGFTGKVLNQLFQRALKIGKKTYLDTTIHKGAVSISLAAVELARNTFGSLADKTVLIVGAGEAANLTAECLLKKRVGKILVTNRTQANAEEFLENLRKSHDFTGEVIGFEDFQNHLNETDIVISSTSSPDYVLNASDFEQQNKKILLIDIAVPRDIAPEVEENEFVILKNIDDLNSMVDRNYENRMSELPLVKKIIYQEMGEFLVWYYSLPLLEEVNNGGDLSDKDRIGEIKRIKEFLEANAAWFRKMMTRQPDNVEAELSEHLHLVNKLYLMKKSASATQGAFNFEK